MSRSIDTVIAKAVIVTSFILAVLVTEQVAAGENLVINGDFTDGNTGFTSDAVYVPPPLPLHFGEYSIRIDPSTANGVWCGSDHTTGTGNLLVVDGFNGTETVAWRQTISVIPNETYDFSAWVMNLVCTQSLADPVMELRVDGVTVAGPLALPESPNLWVPLSGQFTATGATAMLEVASTSTAGNGNDFGIDDISVPQGGEEPIPTVSEWGLVILTLVLGLAGGTIIYGRRRPVRA